MKTESPTASTGTHYSTCFTLCCNTKFAIYYKWFPVCFITHTTQKEKDIQA